MADPLIRALGADHRNTVGAYYHNRGPEFGYKLAARFIEETVAEVAEAHSRRDAYNLVMRVGDRLVKGQLLDALPGIVQAQPDEAPAATATPAPDPATTTYDLGDGQTATITPPQTISGLYDQTVVIARKLKKLRRNDWPAWRRTLWGFFDDTPPWFIGFMVGLALAGLGR
jgi:hypothetical protein